MLARNTDFLHVNAEKISNDLLHYQCRTNHV